MNIKNATFFALAKDMPENCRCEVRTSIGEFGTISLDLWLKDGDKSFAEINFSDSAEMKALANLLYATAEARIAQDA